MQSERRQGVVDVALQGGAFPVAPAADRAKMMQRLRLGDAVFRNLTRAAAIAVLIVLSGIIVSLVHGSWPAFKTFGASFLITEKWNPVTEKFGALAPIYGTLVTAPTRRATACSKPSASMPVRNCSPPGMLKRPATAISISI